MFSIGELSKRTKVKVPTIRYYEEMGLLAAPERTEGNQRRYDAAGLERLSFIRHARDLGFSIEAISSLIELQEHPDRSCQAATEIAVAQLADVACFDPMFWRRMRLAEPNDRFACQFAVKPEPEDSAAFQVSEQFV